MAHFQQTDLECCELMVIGSNQRLNSLSDNQVHVEIDARRDN